MQSAEPTSRRRGRPVKNKNINKIRTFKMPTPNYDANSFQDMIVWKNAQVTEPPILADYSDQQIMEFVEQPLVLDIPSNTQFVERLIRVITQNRYVLPQKGLRILGPFPVRDPGDRIRIYFSSQIAIDE